MNIETEFQQYVETALWSSTDDGGTPLDRDHGMEDLAPESLASMREELQAFIDGADADALAFWQTEHGDGQIGHDFWLTRNGHGAGFWDRWSGGTRGYEHGRRLTDEAKPYGSSDLYVGDDGRLHVS